MPTWPAYSDDSMVLSLSRSMDFNDEVDGGDGGDAAVGVVDDNEANEEEEGVELEVDVEGGEEDEEGERKILQYFFKISFYI